MLTFLHVVLLANDNGLARTPPLGWRSWNLYGANVNQSLIESIMDGMVRKDRKVDGIPTSLCDLGYCDVGLDDNWQACGAYGPDKLHFHDEDGNPLVNTKRFPDFKGMTDHAHKLGLTAGWYGNNCICSERATSDKKFYVGDVKALRNYGFDSWKLDGCGAQAMTPACLAHVLNPATYSPLTPPAPPCPPPRCHRVQTDLQLYDDLIKATPPTGGRSAIMVENCHWGSKVPFKPNATWCPWNFYRTSGDVRARYSSVVGNLQTTGKYAASNLSYPGCWAYPDMVSAPNHPSLREAAHGLPFPTPPPLLGSSRWVASTGRAAKVTPASLRTRLARTSPRGRSSRRRSRSRTTLTTRR